LVRVRLDVLLQELSNLLHAFLRRLPRRR
jgi:hypothetical protein